MSERDNSPQGRDNEKAAGITRREFYHNESLESRNLVFGIILSLLMIAFCIIYGFLFKVKAEVINMTSIFTAIALAILIIPGTCRFTQDSGCCSDTPGSWSGAAWASTCLLWPSASSSTPSSTTSGPGRRSSKITALY